MKSYKCGFLRYTLPDHACVFCKHCTDVFYDSGGIYMLFCDKEDNPDGNLQGNCIEFEEDE